MKRRGRRGWLIFFSSLLVLWSGCGSDGRAQPRSTAESRPLPAGQAVNALSCPSAQLCFAALTQAAAPGTTGPSLGRLMQWNGQRWDLVPSGPGTTAGNPGALTAIACPTSSSCTAVGSSGRKIFATTWNGDSWQATPVPAPPPRPRLPGQPAFQSVPYEVTLSAVACATPTACVAVGAARYPTVDTPNSDTFAVRWDGRSWSLMPLGTGDGREELSAIACPRADDCVAVGTDRSGVEGIVTTPLLERWNGRTWQTASIRSTPGPRGSGLLQGISCPTPTWCLAVGQRPQGSAGPTPSLAVTLSHGKWAEAATPPGEGLSAVSCLAADNCMAAGSAWDSVDRNERPLLAPFDGEWSAVTPTGVPYGILYAVACPTRATCLAGGLSLVTTASSN